MDGKTIEQITIGDFAQSIHTISEAECAAYAQITDDYNPIHFDEAFAAGTRFKGKIAHGMILAGYISGVIGVQLPGAGALYEEQRLHFLLPVRFGDIITTRVTVKELMPERNRVILKTECMNQDQKVVLTGEAIVLPKKEK